MSRRAEQTSENPHEYRVMDWVKAIRGNRILSREELFLEYGKLADEYEALLVKLNQKNLPWANRSPEEILDTEARLFAGVSREFRTPLTLLITALEQMHTSSGNAAQKGKLSMMLRNAQRLFFIIKQTLALSEIERRELKVKASLHDIIPLLKGVMANFDILAEQREVELIFETGPKSVLLYLDQEKMAEVMCNLLMNALKYTPPGGQVKVTVSRPSPEAVSISVCDTGPGIPAAQLESIFDRYYHLRKPFEYDKKGFGIGLYLVKEYITRHGGTIQVNSVAEQGTEFVIQLPVEKEYLTSNETEAFPGPDPDEMTGKEIAAHHALLLQLEREEALLSGDELTGLQTNSWGRDIVLVVEDNTDMLRFISSLLKKSYSVAGAKNGREGLDIAKKMIPDIIISDIIMPDIDGIELCRELKNGIDTSHIPIILLTARAADSEIIRGLKAGADDYIVKPFNVEMLLTRVKNLINLRRQLQEKIARKMRLQPAEISFSEIETRFLDKIQALIEENLSDPDFGVDRLADVFDISRPTLYRKLCALTGLSPKKFIQAYRLKKSVELLKSPYRNITDVAFRVGFSSSAYFTKCFKEAFNRLPSDF